MASIHKTMVPLTEEEKEDLDDALYAVSHFLQSLSIDLAHRYGRKIYGPGFSAQNHVNVLRTVLGFDIGSERDVENGLEFIKYSEDFFEDAREEEWIISGFKGFLRWLLMQKDRDDPVGDVARDLIGDIEMKRAKGERFCDYASGYRELREYLEQINACSEAIASLDEAWQEYKDRRSQK